MERNEGRTQARGIFFLAAIIVSGFLIRLIPLRSSLLPDGSLLFSQHDNYYHLRRAAIYAANFPRFPALDYFLSFPNGAECPWPPLYDAFIAMVSLFSGAGRPDLRSIEMISALLPPLLAVLSVIPLYRIVVMLFRDRRAAFIASMIFIVLPGLLNYSHIASGDHHAAEVFLSLCFFRFALGAVRQTGGGRYLTGPASAAGLFLGIGVCVWQGQVLYYGIWSLFVAVTMLTKRSDYPGLRQVMKQHTVLSAVAVLFILAVRLLFPRATEQSLFGFSFFSYFQPLLIASLWLAGCWLYLLLRARGTGRIVLIAAPAIVIALIPFTRFGVDIREGIVHMFRADPWMASITETKPAVSYDAVRVWIALGLAGPYLYLVPFLYKVWQFSPLVVALAVAAAGVAGRKRGDDAYPWQGALLLGCAGAVLTAPALLQARWDNSLTPFIAISLGIIIAWLWKLCERLIPGKIAMQLAVTLPLSAVLLLPLYPTTRQVLFDYGRGKSIEIFEPLSWLRYQTPAAGPEWIPDRKPDYGVFAFWDAGHYLQYISRRPEIIGNFGFLLRGDNFLDSMTIWKADSEEELVRYCRKYGVRYLLLTDPRNLFNNNSISYFLGDKEIFFQPGNKQFFTLAIPRLMEYDGSAGPYGEAFGRFRLVFESSGFSLPYYHPNRIRQYKIYEFVEGARLAVSTVPGRTVRVTAGFGVSGRRAFGWHAEQKADSSGTAVFLVPYPSKQGNPGAPVQPLSAYTVSDGVSSRVTHVNDEDIAAGRQITLRLR